MATQLSIDSDARVLQLDERVTNLRTGLTNLEGEVRTGFLQMNSSLASLAAELRSGQKTQWPVIWTAIGVGFSIVLAIGGLAYWPVNSQNQDNKIALIAMGDKFERAIESIRTNYISRDETEALRMRGAEERDRISAAIKEAVPRGEWMERNRARDEQIADIGSRINELSHETADARERIFALQEHIAGRGSQSDGQRLP